MNSAINVLAECENLGITVKARPAANLLWVEPISALSKDLEAKLIANKPELLVCLSDSIIAGAGETTAVLCRLHALGVYRHGARLCFRCPGRLTPELEELIAANRTKLVELLSPKLVV